MNPVGTALWYIESHLSGEITLDNIAGASGVSRFHLARAFGYATGVPVMRYLRGRRLTEAAKALAGGAPDILSLALDAGYGSHEAFTRAFRDQFGLTPEGVRAAACLANLKLTEPIEMTQTTLEALRPPRLADGQKLLIAGLSQHLTAETRKNLPALWQRFVPHIGSIPGEIAGITYGVVSNMDDQMNMTYLAGVGVTGFSGLPPEFARQTLAPQHYAVFPHHGHVSTINQTWSAIFANWLPKSDWQHAEAPSFERYDQRFDPATGAGVAEIWVPLAAK